MRSDVLAPNQAVIGIDVGGTKIAAALIGHSGIVLASRTVPTAGSSDAAILRQIEELISEILALSPESISVVGTGLGLPGVVDTMSGTALYAANLPWRHTRVTPHLSGRFGLPVYLDNDANAGALGEKWFGQGREYASFIYLAIGTGIGSGVVVNGRLLTGNRHTSSEAGHMIVMPDGPICRCGTRGCLEVMSAGPAIARRMQQRDSRFQPGSTAQAVIEAAKAGDAGAAQVLEETAQHLAVGVLNLWRLLAPDQIILGGGITQAGDLILEPLKRTISRLSPGRDVIGDYIALSVLKGASGVLGAAAVAIEKVIANPSVPLTSHLPKTAFLRGES